MRQLRRLEAIVERKSKMRFVLLLVLGASVATAQTVPALKLEKTIPLPHVQGRIDHMSIDTQGQRLFVSALGNNTLEVIDLKDGKRSETISGVQEPQGVLYVASNNRLYVANSKDGTVKVFDGTSLKLLKTIAYGEDADNLRYDSSKEHVYVGYGGGALGELDADGQKVADVELGSHPESFQLEKNSPRIYVNLPKSKKIAVLDREKRSVLAAWGTGLSLANYPMALDEPDHRLFVVTRYPARLLVFDTGSGKIIQTLPAVGDCDDVFFDAARKRIYAIGGEGGISVFAQQDPDHYSEIARIPTVKGARTGFFSPELNRLFVGVRKQGTAAAAIEVFEAKP
jgi:DNA-binding beta-propeller fold protein YncE